jgi:hypothetical protein
MSALLQPVRPSHRVTIIYKIFPWRSSMKSKRLRPRHRTVRGACLLAACLLAASTVAVALTPPPFAAAEHGVGVRADPLLSVDLNRTEIVGKIVARWQNDLSESQRDGFRIKVLQLRADRLLAASLVGSFDGVLDVLYGQEQSKPALALTEATRQTRGDTRKALGDTAADLVYTPISPCRIVDTRIASGGPGPRASGSTTPFNAVAASFVAQGGSGTSCNIPAGAAAMAGTFAMLSATSIGYLSMWAVDAPQPTAATGLFNPTSQQPLNSSSAIVPLCTAATCTAAKQFNVFVAGSALDVTFDVTGYFKAPGGTVGDITEVSTGVAATSGLTGGVTSGVAALSLAPSYKLPQSCGTGNVPKFNATSSLWECQAGTSGGSGTVTSIATGAGLTGGPITGTGTIGLAASQLLPTTTCADSQTLIWNSTGSNWICAPWQPPGLGLPTCLTGQVLRFGASGALSCGTLPNSINTITAAGLSIGVFNAVAVPTDGRPVIAYLEGGGGVVAKLKVAKCADINCSTSNISIVDSATGNYNYPSIAISADGLPVISYYDGTALDLKVAKCGNADCNNGNSIVTVDAAGDVGRYTSIAVPADGLPVISYYSNGTGFLKVAKCGSASCSSGNTVSTVVTSAIDGFSAITVPADGLPIIAYSNGTTNNLAVAKCGNASCSSGNTITAVDTATITSDKMAIAVSADGLPVISYLELLAGDSRLRVTKCGNAGCSGGNTSVIVDAALGTGAYSSIAVPLDGKPVISYYDFGSGGSNKDLKVAKCGNATCSSGNTLTALDSAGDVGAYTALKVPADGLPVISYFDRTNTQLKVVKCSNAACLKP